MQSNLIQIILFPEISLIFITIFLILFGLFQKKNSFNKLQNHVKFIKQLQKSRTTTKIRKSVKNIKGKSSGDESPLSSSLA